jgi:hypothetical protein
MSRSRLVRLADLRRHREQQLDTALFYLQVAEDNGYCWSEDGRGEIRYSQREAARARRSIRRIDRWWAIAQREALSRG